MFALEGVFKCMYEALCFFKQTNFKILYHLFKFWLKLSHKSQLEKKRFIKGENLVKGGEMVGVWAKPIARYFRTLQKGN